MMSPKNHFANVSVDVSRDIVFVNILEQTFPRERIEDSYICMLHVSFDVHTYRFVQLGHLKARQIIEMKKRAPGK